MKKYMGELKRIGEGTKEMSYGITKYSVLEIGDDLIKSVSANEIVSTYLDVGQNLELYVGPLFFRKFIYAVRSAEGRLVKMGIGLFILSLFIKILGALPALFRS